jgi:hypothetical protein
MKQAPLWTAFIHQYILHIDWAHRVGPRDVELQELQQYIFISGYVPTTTSNGKFRLEFRVKNGELPVLYAFQN